MLFPVIKEIRPVLFGSSSSVVLGAASNPVNLVIPRQSRRLAQIMLFATVTIATPTSTGSRDAIEGFLSEIRLIASDKAGSNRTVRKMSSSDLVAVNRRTYGKLDRFTQQAFGKKAAAQYTIALKLDVMDPLLGDTVAPKTAMPLWTTDANGDGLGEDLRLEIDVGNNASVGLSAGTVTINTLNALITYLETPAGVPYVPTEIITNLNDWGTGGGEVNWQLPEKGWLAGLVHHGFTSATARGDIGAAGNKFQLFFGRSNRSEFTTAMAQAWDGEYQMDYPNGETTFASNDTGVWSYDFLHDSPIAQTIAGASLWNLYTANAGDRAYLRLTNAAANASSRITVYKILQPDLSPLVGA